MPNFNILRLGVCQIIMAKIDFKSFYKQKSLIAPQNRLAMLFYKPYQPYLKSTISYGKIEDILLVLDHINVLHCTRSEERRD